MKRTLCALLLALGLTAGARAQAFTADVRQAGYVHAEDTTYFVFDPSLYGLAGVERVVVTGAFRNWDANMELPGWRLARRGDVWVLPVANPEYKTIGPGMPFKYRIDDGRWLDPPATAPNQEGGNLVFLYGAEPPRLRAELRGPRAVWAVVTGDGVERPLDAAAYRLVDAHGRAVPVAAVLPNTATETLVVPAEDLDVRRAYYLEVPGLDLRALCRYDGWFRTLYSDKPLGAEVSADGSRTTFRVFAPRLDSLKLYLYHGPDDAPEDAYKVVDMARDAQGVWEAAEAGDLHGVYYDFTAHGPDDPGNLFYGTRPVHLSDPYARVNVDAFGKSRVWRPTQPAPPLAGGRPAMEDVVAYEVHVQDFTDRLPVPDHLKGTLEAMALPGLRNERGEPVGFDYLVGLGINVLHLLPVQEYLHYPDDEWQAAFADDPFMQEMGIAEENYQWGYRTTHAFAVESRFRTKGTEHGAQREQFRDLVRAYHEKGIAVIVDLVPNHTGENMDMRDLVLNFNGFDRPYYYRTDEALDLIGPYGNEVKFEERPMVQRWLIDQCRHLIEEFGIDGFRIDLAGQIDEQTLRALRAALGDDVIIYGEPWIAPSDPDVVANPDWAWYKEDAPITFFQDTARDAFKGSPFQLVDKARDRGYPGGNATLREDVMRALANDFPEEAASPNRGLNYLDIHDNWALADRFATADWDGRQGVDEDRYKLAAGLLLTSLGPVVLHGGSEIMRSKGLAPIGEEEKHTATGPIFLKGRHDTYNLRRPNHFVWSDVGRARGEGGSPNDYRGMQAYWQGLIALRNSGYGEVFRLGTPPEPGHYRWLLPEDPSLLGYVVGGRVLVLVNTGEEAAAFEGVDLPAGAWRLVADAETVDVAGIAGPDARFTGGRSVDLRVPAASLKIWVRE